MITRAPQNLKKHSLVKVPSSFQNGQKTETLKLNVIGLKSPLLAAEANCPVELLKSSIMN